MMKQEVLFEERLRAILSGVTWLKNIKTWRNPSPALRAFDICASFEVPGGNKVDLWVQCHELPRPSQFPFAAHRNQFSEDGSRRTQAHVLAAPTVSERMAALCFKHGWHWFDLAGNCRISIPGAIHLERTGQKAVYRRPKPEANLGTTAAGRVVGALLFGMNLGRKWTQRSLRDFCQPGVSLGLVNKVVRHLREQAYLVDLKGESGFKLRDPLGLLTEWNSAYRFDHHTQRDYFTLMRPDKLRDALGDLSSVTGGHAAFALFSAADVQAPHVRQGKTWLYLQKGYEETLLEKAEAKAVESGANLIVLYPEDDGVFQGQIVEKGSRLPCTNPVQTYIDLMHADGRGEEAADAILKQKLKPDWKEHGLVW